MAIRINKAKNFAGEFYALERDLKTYIKSSSNATFDKATGIVTLKNGNDEDFTIDLSTLVVAAATGGLSVTKNSLSINVDASTITISADNKLTIAKAVMDRLTAIENKFTSITGVTAQGEETDAVIGAASTDATVPTAKAVATAIAKAGVKIVKAEQTTEGFAATYKLVGVDGTAVDGSADINIFKDKFLKSVEVKYGTSATVGANNTIPGESASRTEEAPYPFLVLNVYVNADVTAPATETSVSRVVLPLQDVLRPNTAGNGIDAEQFAADGRIDVKIDATSEKVVTAEGVETPVLSVSSAGVKATGIGAAIAHAIAPVAAIAARAVQLIEESVTLTYEGNVASGTVAGRVLGVWDTAGNVILPDQVWDGNNTTLSADFGTAEHDTTWTVVYTKLASVDPQ